MLKHIENQWRQWAEKTAIVWLKEEQQTLKYTYKELITLADEYLKQLLAIQSAENWEGERVALLAEPTPYYIAWIIAIWRLRAIVVPISTAAPTPEIDYICEDSQALLLIQGQALTQKISIQTNAIAKTLLQQSPALMIYTSGTTSRPKGVLISHAQLLNQVQILHHAWQWTAEDVILHTLPLHHIHGLVNILFCALSTGAEVVLLPQFSPEKVWNEWLTQKYTLYMAVPTIYNRLIQYWQQANPTLQQKYSEATSKMRLMVSGSAPLPVSVLQEWQKITSHFLLERYGMTEIGMALSNPLVGERKAGTVGIALPTVAVRLVDEQGKIIENNNEAGEIQVKSPSVFMAYWQREQLSKESFTEEGWFKTGDMAQRNEEGYYTILGRISTDIIKSAGYKLSALEIEEALRAHPDIADCAVIALPDEDKGESVAALLVLKPQKIALANTVKEWLKTKITAYKIPKHIYFAEALPKNTMGKVVKTEVKQIITTLLRK